jgi:hypothetical protein
VEHANAIDAFHNDLLIRLNHDSGRTAHFLVDPGGKKRKAVRKSRKDETAFSPNPKTGGFYLPVARPSMGHFGENPDYH